MSHLDQCKKGGWKSFGVVKNQSQRGRSVKNDAKNGEASVFSSDIHLTPSGHAALVESLTRQATRLLKHL